MWEHEPERKESLYSLPLENQNGIFESKSLVFIW